MKLTEIADKMPLLVDMRPDFMLDKWEAILLKAAIYIAQTGRLMTAKFEVDLESCIPDYKLDMCEQRIVSIKQICWYPPTRAVGVQPSGVCGAPAIAPSRPCCVDISGHESINIVAREWCAIPGCGESQFRFVPPDTIEVGPVSGLSGRLAITALVAPNHDACSIDDRFFYEYGAALFEQAAFEALTMPGEGYNGNEAQRRRLLAVAEISRMATHARMGYSNKAPRVQAARRMV